LKKGRWKKEKPRREQEKGEEKEGAKRMSKTITLNKTAGGEFKKGQGSQGLRYGKRTEQARILVKSRKKGRGSRNEDGILEKSNRKREKKKAKVVIPAMVETRDVFVLGWVCFRLGRKKEEKRKPSLWEVKRWEGRGADPDKGFT